MPWLPMYLNSKDKTLLIDWLDNEDDIAEIISNGKKCWIATNRIDFTLSKRYCLWHNKSGHLPLLKSGKNIFGKEKSDGIIKNPYDGWEEQRTGANPTFPYFGSGHTGIFWLNLNEKKETLSLDSFEWIGNHYSILGDKAPEVTMKWWQRLRRFVKKNATQIPRTGNIENDDKEIWVFPGALEEIKSGKKRDDNPI